MLRSLYTGVSGLKNFQTGMDVISNNIANVSTTGFKRGRVSFENLFSETLRHGQQAFGSYGGLNPMQVGLGVKAASIDTIMDAGAIQYTGKETDVAIEGDGFLVVRGYDGVSYYTRDGNLNIGTNYDLVMTNTGYKVQGWLAQQDLQTGELKISDSGIVPEPLNLAKYLKKAAKQTNNIVYSCNLNAGSDERDITMGEDTLTFLDSKGISQNLQFKFKKVDANNWVWTAYDDTEGHVATGSLKVDDEGMILESRVDPEGALSTDGNPYFTYDPDGDPTPAMVTSPTPSAGNTNYLSGNAGSFSSITLDDNEIVDEDIKVIFDGGDPDHATSYRVVGSERGFIGSGTIGGTPARIVGEVVNDLTTGVWQPAADTSFTITDGFTASTTALITFTGGTNYTTEQVSNMINEAMDAAGVRATAYFDSVLGQFQIVSNESGSNRSLQLDVVDAGSIAELGLASTDGVLEVGAGSSRAELLSAPNTFTDAPIVFTDDLQFTVQDTTGCRAVVKFVAQDNTVVPPADIAYNPSTILAQINTALRQNGLDCSATLIDSNSDGVLDQLQFLGADTGSGEYITVSHVSGDMTQLGLQNTTQTVNGTAGTSNFKYGGIEFTINEGSDVWAPNDYYTFSTYAAKGQAESVKIYCPQPNQDVVKFKTTVVDALLGTEREYKIEGAVSQGALHSTSITIYDSLGAAHNLVTTWEHMNTATMEWDYKVSYADDDPEIISWLKDPLNNVKDWKNPTDDDLKRANDALITNRTGTLYFNGGKINSAKTEAPNFEITPKGSVKMSVALDTTMITQFDSDFTTKAESQDGYEMGMLEEIYFEEDGTIRGVYSNGQKQPVAMVALATFNNPSGLEDEGANLYSYSPNSGLAIIRRPGVGSAGVIRASSLEMSNVDISEEFTNMIVTQRAFQANSRIITTSDEMLQEVVNLKR